MRYLVTGRVRSRVGAKLWRRVQLRIPPLMVARRRSLHRSERLCRILFLPSWYPSPVNPVLGTFVQEHAKAAALHHDVCVIYPYQVDSSHHSATSATEDAVLTIRQPFTPVPWPRLFPLHYLLAFHRATRHLPPKWRPDVLHLHVGYPAGLAAAYCLIRWRAPLVYTEAAGPLAEKLLATRVARWCLPRVARRARLGAPVSRFLARDMAGAGLLPKRVEILPNAVDVGIFRPPGVRRSTDESVCLLTAAMLVPGKGIEHAIDAVALLRREGQVVCLTIAGDGPLRSKLESRAAMQSVSQYVAFLGMLTKPELAIEMNRHDAFLMPSDRETFSAVVVEAMASGLPVVATRCGGPDDLVTTDTGVLVNPGSPAALAEAVLEVVATPERFSGGPDRVRQHYSVEAVADRLTELYRMVLT